MPEEAISNRPRVAGRKTGKRSPDHVQPTSGSGPQATPTSGFAPFGGRLPILVAHMAAAAVGPDLANAGTVAYLYGVAGLARIGYAFHR